MKSQKMVGAVLLSMSLGAAAQPLAGSARVAAQQCRAHPTVSACNDALRWNPSDPGLLVAMGDALVRVQRPADAVRVYQRAATLAPDTPGIKEKNAAAEALLAKSKLNKVARDTSVAADTSVKRFSNSEPDTQTH